MAYNLQPLIQIIEQILYPHYHHNPHNWILDHSTKPILESLLDKVCSVEGFFENSPSLTGHAVQALEIRIRDSAYLAQNIIESYLVTLLIPQPKGVNIFISPPYNIIRIIEGCEFENILGEIRKITGVNDASSSNLVSSRQHLSTPKDLNPENIIVGTNEDVAQLKEKLIMPLESKLEIIPIVGMGGIGKTTLARTLYNDQSVVSYFDIRAWIAISQSYSEGGILSGLLKCISAEQSHNPDLGLQLYQALFNRRYLIVLDDMWSFEAWDCIKMCFPNQNNGSRILVTTREQRVADYVATAQNLYHQMKLFDEADSWKLLCRKVLQKETCPLELEQVGKDIAKDCGGLPLAIHVIGGVLLLKPKTREAWMHVARDVSSSMANNHEQLSNILSLSYNHLPNHLKPCFLYMAAFPEDCEIQASRLIRLWMAEGFVRPISGMSLEETASLYLKELVERNLLLVWQQEIRRKVKSCIMHDLLRDLCIKKAQEENFLYGDIDAIKDLNPKEMLRLRLSIHVSGDQFTHILRSRDIPVVHSILLFASFAVEELSWLSDVRGLQLLKVLDILSASSVRLPKEVEGLINLRYLAGHISNTYLYSVPNLYSLQTLILHLEYDDFSVVNVRELMEMSQLRHIKFKGQYYPFFGLETWEFGREPWEYVLNVHEELQTLSNVAIDDSFPYILKHIPNLKKLGIQLSSVSSTIDLTSLTQLQILKCGFHSWRSFNLIIPPSLKKLTLHQCNIPSGFLNEIGRLPNLQVFKVKMCWLDDSKLGGCWKPAEGEFQQLRLLRLESFIIEKWMADGMHYPRLEHLIIYGCHILKEIPSGIGDIYTLEIIEVHRSSTSIVNSARKIQEEQLDYGNGFLQVRIDARSSEAEDEDEDEEGEGDSSSNCEEEVEEEEEEEEEDEVEDSEKEEEKSSEGGGEEFKEESCTAKTERGTEGTPATKKVAVESSGAVQDRGAATQKESSSKGCYDLIKRCSCFSNKN